MLRICLILSFLFFIGCSDEFPARTLYQVDLNKKICDEYELNPDTLKIRFVKAVPIEQCESVIGFTNEDAALVVRWAKRMKTKAKECL